MTQSLTRRLAAEAVGTFALVFAGTGAIVFDDISGGKITHVGVALTFGLIVTVMVYTVGPVSGAHLNPAVSVVLCVAYKFPRRDVLPYIAAQLAGALAASALLTLIAPHPTLGATLPQTGWRASFVLELWLTAMLLFIVLSLGAADPSICPLTGLIVGAVITLEALFAGPICGASMNPARSVAPAVLSGRVEHLWVYLAAPLLGGLGAVPVCRCVQKPGCCSARPEVSG